MYRTLEGNQENRKKSNQRGKLHSERNTKLGQTRPSYHNKNIWDLWGLRVSLSGYWVTFVPTYSLCEGGELFEKLDKTGSFS